MKVHRFSFVNVIAFVLVGVLFVVGLFVLGFVVWVGVFFAIFGCGQKDII